MPAPHPIFGSLDLPCRPLIVHSGKYCTTYDLSLIHI